MLALLIDASLDREILQRIIPIVITLKSKFIRLLAVTWSKRTLLQGGNVLQAPAVVDQDVWFAEGALDPYGHLLTSGFGVELLLSELGAAHTITGITEITILEAE